MENYFDDLPNLSLEDITDRLESLADKTQELTYLKEFSIEEIDRLKTILPDSLIELTKKKQALKEQMKIAKAEMALITQEIDSAVNKITNRSEEVTEVVYLVADQEEKRMLYINPDGFIIQQRPLMASERQLRITDNFAKSSNS